MSRAGDSLVDVGYRGQWRDRAAVAFCNFVLRTFATRRYRLTLDAVVRQGLDSKLRRPTEARTVVKRG